MTWLDSFKETNKPIEYKKVWYDNKLYLLPCDPKLVKIVLRSDTEPEFIYEDDMIRGKRANYFELDDLCYDFYKKGIDDVIATFEKDTAPKFELGDSREDYWYKVYGRSFDRLRKTMEIINCRKDNNMISNIPTITNIPKIVDYKYIAENGVTIIRWSDSTSTTVTCDPKTADQYTGFVTAIAKKAFGNGGKMLSEWDRLVIKPIEDAKKAEEKAKIEAEKKAKEDKIHAEAKAKRDAKKAERKRKREIEKLAKQIADEYYAQELTEEAEKLAVKKYGVPKSYLDEYDCDCCECKEFDVMDDETITD